MDSLATFVSQFEEKAGLPVPDKALNKLWGHVQNGRFGACLRVVHKAEAAIKCHHTQLGALLNRAAGSLHFKKTKRLVT